MEYKTVEFMGEKYQIPESIKDFLHYDNLLTPQRNKMINKLTQDIKHDSRYLTFGGETTDYVDKNANSYQKLMKECVNVLINELFSLGIYDVTENELLKNITSLDDIMKLRMDVLNYMVDEGHRYIELKNAGLEHAYRSAVSNITGSGLMIFTNSISALVAHSLAERSILLSQAKKADKEYDEAVRAINSSTRRALDTMVSETMIKKYYPEVMDILINFSLKITSAFLKELVQHEKLDFESIEKYNLSKAEQMLSNINRVPDKMDFLKQVFEICPFSLNLYLECYKYGLLDIETFLTAKYFGFGDALADKIEVFVKNNLDNKKTETYIKMLAIHKNTNEKEILYRIYLPTIDKIESSYEFIKQALNNKKILDRFVRENISSNISEVVQKTENEIRNDIKQYISSVVTKEEYLKLLDREFISPFKLREEGSNATDLEDINKEFCNDLETTIFEYIEEANRRLQRYNDSKLLLDNDLKMMRNELDSLEVQKSKLGLFAISKKRELANKIENKSNEIEEKKKNHESNKLWNYFERMYK